MKTDELRGKEQEDLFPVILYFSKPCDETEIKRTINPTWIQSKKKHVEKDGGQKDSPERERARAGQREFSVEKPEHGFNFMNYDSCRRQTQSEIQCIDYLYLATQYKS